MLLLMLLLSLSACSFNGIGTPGTVDRQITNTAVGREEITHARGIHLYTRGGLGLHVGAIERQLFYPASGGDPLECAAGNETPTAAPGAGVRYERAPAVITSDSAGLGLDMNRFGARLTAGLKRRYEMRAPMERGYVYTFHTGVDPKRPVFCLLNEEQSP